MTVFIGLLRAVNVGGSGKLAMADLKAICVEAGFGEVATFIQSGNVVFSTTLDERQAESLLNASLAKHMGTAPGVFLLTPQRLAGLLDACPFAEKPGNRVIVSFFKEAFDPDALDAMSAPDSEQAAIIDGTVHLYYPKGIGRSKLKLSGLAKGTARNLNTLHKLKTMAEALVAGETLLP